MEAVKSINLSDFSICELSNVVQLKLQNSMHIDLYMSGVKLKISVYRYRVFIN